MMDENTVKRDLGSVINLETMGDKESYSIIAKGILLVLEKLSNVDDRPLEQQKEFPLRDFSLGVCICGHGDEDHATDLTHLGIKDGICQVCVCKEFTPQTRRGEKLTSC